MQKAVHDQSLKHRKEQAALARSQNEFLKTSNGYFKRQDPPAEQATAA